MKYDAAWDPDPKAWLKTDEAVRLQAVQAHHRNARRSHPLAPRPETHAVMHLAVENQIAEGVPPQARQALQRLIAEGIGRHEAIHAIAAVLAHILWQASQGQPYEGPEYARRLDALTADSWLEMDRAMDESW